MSESWKEGLKKALLEVIMKDGSLVREKPNEFMWQDYSHGERGKQARRLVDAVGIDWAKTDMPDVSAWSEFVGTFADPPYDTKHGVDALVVLNDGTEYRYRLEIDLGRLIQKVVTA